VGGRGGGTNQWVDRDSSVPGFGEAMVAVFAGAVPAEEHEGRPEEDGQRMKGGKKQHERRKYGMLGLGIEKKCKISELSARGGENKRKIMSRYTIKPGKSK